MFENMNPLDKSTAWFEIFLLMLGAFLIGYFFARSYFKSKYKGLLDLCHEEKEKLKKIGYTKANTTFHKETKEDDTTAEETAIKAVKTRERDGSSTSSNNPPPVLNFESFGKAEASEKDDLKLISGIGPFIEEKLNSIGIYTFDQISRFNTEDIQTVTELIQFFPGRIERDDWKGQAHLLKNRKE